MARLKKNQWTLGAWTLCLGPTRSYWKFGDTFTRLWLSDADLRHIARLCEKALKYRSKAKAK